VSTGCVFSAGSAYFQCKLYEVQRFFPLRSQRSELKIVLLLEKRRAMSRLSYQPIKIEEGAGHTISTLSSIYDMSLKGYREI